MEQINFGDNDGKAFGFAEQLQQDWLNACLAADIPAVTRDTAARLLAVLYVHGGGHEEMVMNRKFTNELRYIQRRYGIEGGQRPDADVVSLVQHYVTELQQYEHRHCPCGSIRPGKEKPAKEAETVASGGSPASTTTDADGNTVIDTAPEWAVSLFLDRYGIKLRH